MLQPCVTWIACARKSHDSHGEPARANRFGWFSKQDLRGAALFKALLKLQRDGLPPPKLSCQFLDSMMRQPITCANLRHGSRPLLCFVGDGLYVYAKV